MDKKQFAITSEVDEGRVLAIVICVEPHYLECWAEGYFGFIANNNPTIEPEGDLKIKVSYPYSEPKPEKDYFGCGEVVANITIGTDTTLEHIKVQALPFGATNIYNQI